MQCRFHYNIDKKSREMGCGPYLFGSVNCVCCSRVEAVIIDEDKKCNATRGCIFPGNLT